MTEIQILSEIKELESKVEKMQYSITATFRNLPKDTFKSLVQRFNLVVPAGCKGSCYMRFFSEKIKLLIIISYQ